MLKVTFVLALTALNFLQADGDNKPKQQSPKIANPVDQTDIFAIPLDEDEQDQDEELEEMEHYKR